MKRFLITSILAAILATGTAIVAQDQPDEYLGLPGDNLNLYAVMNLFQQSETLEGFEKSLNDENTKINNLDLNNDNLTDYINVVDYVDGDVHTIVLRAALDKNESQDLAVFTVQKLRDGSVQIQLIGDEALYGKNYIIEPIYAETPNPGYTGRTNRQNVTVVRTTYVEVAAWPVVRFIFLPDYVVWRSSWYWGFYPSYWHPWRPFYWHYYYGYHYHWFPDYYAHFHRWDYPRYTRWNDFYYHDKRVYSRSVTININEGRYKTTYSRPETRREGEALYAKAHPERASTIPAGNNARRSASTGNNNRAVNRANTTVNNRANPKSTAGQSTVTTRRSSETVRSRSASKPEPGLKAEPAKSSRQESAKSSTTGRRSSEIKKSESSSKKSNTTKESSSSSSRRR